jgi:hypothetical protein
MLGKYNAIYCDQCGCFEDFFYSVGVKKDIGNGNVWESWWEVCRTCLKNINSWNTEKRTGTVRRGSNYHNLRRKKFFELLNEYKEQQAVKSLPNANPFGFSQVKTV